MKRPKTIEELYSRGAKFPYGNHSAQEPGKLPPHGTPRNPSASLQRAQEPEDQQDNPRYHNDVGRRWTRGFDGLSRVESAAGKPNFERARDWWSGRLRLREGD